MVNVFLQIKRLALSRTGKGSVVLFSGNVVASVFGIIFTVLSARLLGPSNWGIAAAVASFIPVLVAFGDLGIGSGLFQFASGKWGTKDEDEAYRSYSIAFFIRLLTLGAFVLLLALLSGVISELVFGVGDVGLVHLSVLGLVAVSLFDFQLLTIQSRQEWKRASLMIGGAGLLRILLLVAFFSFGFLSVASVIFAYAGGSMLIFIVSIVWLKRFPVLSRGWVDFAKKIASFSAWMSGNKIVSTLASRVDVLILLQMAGAHDTGIYAAANRLVMGIPLFAGSLATVFAASFASFGDDASARRYFRKAVVFSFGLSVVVLFGVFLAPYITFFLGREYVESTRVLQWLIVAILPLVFSNPAVNVLIYHFKKPKIVTYLSIVQVVIIVLVNYYMIPKIGVFAPVLALGIAQYLTTSVTYIFALYCLSKR